MEVEELLSTFLTPEDARSLSATLPAPTVEQLEARPAPSAVLPSRRLPHSCQALVVLAR